MSLLPVARPRSWAPAPIAQTPSQPVQAQSVQVVKKPGFKLFGNQRICNSRGIQGTRVDPVRGRLAGCSILNPVKVTAIKGVQLTQPITVDCPTARALADWVEDGIAPAIGNRGGGLAVIQVIGSYSCRTRNSQPGAKLSEHARGRAVDIAGFRTANGDTYSVQKNWGKGAKGRILRKIHALGCGPFGTVLGPNSDQYHQGHFHVDTANRRGGGTYCR